MADDDRFYVKTLTLENFRCFEKAELGPFDPHFNLLIGENGAGKSSVLVALSYIFASIGTEPQRPIPMMGVLSDIRKFNGLEDLMSRKTPFHSELQAAYLPAASFSARRYRSDQNATMTISNDRDSSLVATRSSGSYMIFARGESHGETVALPFIASYNTERRFVADNTRDHAPESLLSPRYAAMNGWANAGLQSQALTKWLNDETLAKFQGDARYYLTRGDEEPESGFFIDLVVAAVREGVEGARNIEYNGRAGEIVVTYKDGRRQKLSEMSDGQRALVCLFADLARRMCILNGKSLEERTLLETPGLVLIDEIDLHLHPKWQRQIVPALKKVFPKIQFFATTHSPQVIGECEPKEIVLLTKDGQQKRPHASFGMDSRWILECVMEAEGRDPEIAKRISTLLNMIDDGQFEEAKAEISRLRGIIGMDPDVVAAETYIWNVEHSADEAAE